MRLFIKSTERKPCNGGFAPGVLFSIIAALFIFSVFLTSCKMLPVKKNRYYTEDEFLMIEKSAGAIGLGFGYDSRSDMNYFFFKQPLDKNILEAAVSYQQPDEQQLPDEEKKPASKAEKQNPKKTEAQLSADPGALMRGDFASTLDSYDDRALFYFYSKIVNIYEKTEYMTEWYRRHKRWRLYNQARLDYRPAVDWYMKNLEAYCSAKRPKLYQEIVQQKDDLKRDAILEFQHKMTIVDEY